MANPWSGGRLVTPEAVVVDLDAAGLGSRVVAALLDLTGQVALLFLGLLAIQVASGGDVAGAVLLALLTLLVMAIFLGYPIAWETLWRGRTPGKAVLGLRVVTTTGAAIRFRHAAVRGFVGLIDVWLLWGSIGVLAMLLSPRSQRLGDMAAGTLVVRERSAARAPAPVWFSVPLGYEAYAATIDVGALSPSEYQAARAFLTRAPALPAEVRGRLAAEVATPLAARLRHSVPPGVVPEAFLACVAANYQRRFAPTQ